MAHKIDLKYWHKMAFSFLGGLSLHLTTLYNHEWASLISYLGHFPLDFFCQIWTQDSLRHLLWHLMTNFEICQLLATLGLFEYFGQNPRSSENQFFLNEGVTTLQWSLGVLGGQVPRLYCGTIFGGTTHLGGLAGHWKWKFHFLTHLQQLRGYSALTDLVKNQSTGVD